MKKFFTGPRLRALAAALFFLLFFWGLAKHTGWGTASSFGIAEIAAVCPLGSLEVLLASKTFLPRTVIAVVVFLIVAVLLGRFFCGWLCPVPWVEKVLSRLRPRRRQDLRANFHESRSEKTETNDLPSSSRIGVANASHTAQSPLNEANPSCRADGSTSCPQPCGSSGYDFASSRNCRDCALAAKVKAKTDNAVTKTPFVILGGALASSAVFGFPVFCLICPVGLTFALTIALWRLFAFNETNWAILWFAGFLVLELLVFRRWCSRFCPLGALWTLASRLNRFFRPKADEALCTRTAHGAACTICRDVCPEGIDPAAAMRDPALLARCTKCGSCAAACPTGAVHFPFLSSSGKKTLPIAPVSTLTADTFVSSRVAGGERAQALPSNAGDAVSSPSIPTNAANLAETALTREIARCIHCGACGERCPLGDRMPRATALLARGRRKEAAEVLLAPGGFPEITSRVCPAERFCEGACAIEHNGNPVAIARLEETLSDEALRAGWRPDVRHAVKRRRVAVVGSGPAGLAAADVLSRLGVEVHVLDRAPVAGGLLSLGIPSFKLPREIVAGRVQLLNDAGVRFALGLSVGQNIEPGVDKEGEQDVGPCVAWRDLLREFDAVFAATGAARPVTLDLPGAADCSAIVTADRFLRAAAARDWKRPEVGFPLDDAAGRRVAVLGGGDTALDCARTALRLGAKSVALVARREKKALRARPSDLALARQEGMTLLCRRSVVGLLTNAEGALEGISLSDLDHPEEVPEILAADVVIVAYGFRCVPDEELRTLGVDYDEAGRIKVDAEGRTAHPKLWAGGDAVRGPALVNRALADGRRAGLSIAEAIGVLR